MRVERATRPKGLVYGTSSNGESFHNFYSDLGSKVFKLGKVPTFVSQLG